MPRIDELVRAMEHIAPTRLAADWDNVGLLVHTHDHVARIGLCIDLTQAVLQELIDTDVDTIIAYHPPIFRGLKRFAGRTASERVVMSLLQRNLNVYSPHTALDAAKDGMNDWLLRGLGDVTDVRAIEPSEAPDVGMGRLAALTTPANLSVIVDRVKAHLGLNVVRVAATERHHSGASIKTVAVCPGAGGSLFASLRGPDLYLTGEMRHHDVLAKVSAGAAVILTDHTNTERGYLPVLAERLKAALDVPIIVSAVDADPLRVV
ncbi:MAG: dinuclear metal center YbgI/SA1388 family protein [Kiritimatiellia bacterium]|jgi:dinuclear metal center YbgI/SA1388 family protein